MLPFSFGSGVSRRGVLIDISAQTDAYEVEVELHTRLRRHVLAADLLLIRPSILEMREPKPKDSERALVKAISARFPNAELRLISSNKYKHKVGNNLSSSFSSLDEIDQSDVLDSLRNEELWQTIRRTAALYSSGDNYVFRLPSGVLANHFIRVGNVQTSIDELNRLFFWMLPHLADVEGILADTWSIGQIVMNCSLLLQTYDTSRTPLKVQMVGGYFDGESSSREHLLKHVDDVSNAGTERFLVVFSAAMTWRSVRNLSSSLTYHGGYSNKVKFLVLYKLSRDECKLAGLEIPKLCDVSDKIRLGYWRDQRDDKAVIEIDKSTYFPSFVKERYVELGPAIAKANQQFFELYGHSEGIRIHADSYASGQKIRHHGVYLDVGKFLDIGAFVEKLKQVLRTYEPNPSMLVVPRHRAGQAFSRVVTDVLGELGMQAPAVFPDLDAGNILSPSMSAEQVEAASDFVEILKRLGPGDAIIVLDDVITTGSRLKTYQKRLRDIGCVGRIHYLVGVQRMSSKSEFAHLRSTLVANNLGEKHTVNAVETIVLPDWDESNCPLCVEERLVSRILEDGLDHLSDSVTERLELLRSSQEKGLVDQVFFQPRTCSPLRLGINSYFGPEGMREASVMAAVASAVQMLRVNDDTSNRLEYHGFPLRTVFSKKSLDSYTDGIIRAAIFRALDAFEIRRVERKKDSELVDWARQIFKGDKDDDPQMYAELALAIGLRKLPADVVDAEIKMKLQQICEGDLLHLARR